MTCAAASHPSPTCQVFLLGLVFLLVFTSYSTIEAYAEDSYGEDLGSAMETAVYAAFFVGCFFSPSITNKLGVRLTMFLGILGGYGVLAVASMGYTLSKGGEGTTSSSEWSRLVVFGGAMTGLGASLLWTAQGRLLLEYVEMDGGRNSGRLFSLFWSCYNLSSVVGGFLSFGVFSVGEDSEQVLYGVFVCLIVLGASLTFLLRVPTPTMRHIARLGGDKDEAISHDSWAVEMKETLVMFRSPHMLGLSLSFLSRGLCVPYQSNTFGNRYFDERTLGLEVAIYAGIQVVGSVVVGGLIDQWPPSRRRAIAVRVLLAILVVVVVSNGGAFYLELPYVWTEEVPQINYMDLQSVAIPTTIFALWGLSDVLMQLYSYWLIGVVYVHAKDQARAVGFYKAITSLGWMTGFLCMPKHRVAPMIQLAATTICLVGGTIVALLAALPPREVDPSSLEGEASSFHYRLLVEEERRKTEKRRRGSSLSDNNSSNSYLQESQSASITRAGSLLLASSSPRLRKVADEWKMGDDSDLSSSSDERL